MMHKCSLQEEFVDEGTTNEHGESRKKETKEQKRNTSYKIEKNRLNSSKKVQKTTETFIRMH